VTTADGALERARRLAPQIAASADEIERGRRLPGALVAALHEAGMFRLLLPRALDGSELDPATFVRVTETLGRVDASTAWVVCQTAGCSMVAAYLQPAVAREIFGGDPGGVLAWGPPTRSRAVVVDGGYRLSGTFTFASGGRHATWLGGQAPIVEADGTPRQRNGVTERRTLLFPAGRAPNSLYASGSGGVALGLARSLLDDLLALARDKTPRGYSKTLRESAVTQSQVAQAEARLASARLYLLSSLEEIWREVDRTGALGLDQRVTIRLAASHAIRTAREVADVAYHAAGGTAVYAANAFERRFRDVHTVAQQLQGRDDHFETVGKHLLGLPADTTRL
jgi:alkylation response protein AidB-like acyl-CoA dehydrogenase